MRLLWLHLLHILLLILTAQPALAQDESDQTPSGDAALADRLRNRIDITALYLDTSSSDSVTAVIGYTRDLASNMSFGLQLMYLDSDFNGEGSRGLGDSTLIFSYVPKLSVANNPWLPKRVGTGVSVLLPTGDADERRGFDVTVITPFTGLVYPLSDRLVFLPSLAYAHSFGKAITGTEIRVGSLEVGLSYVGFEKFWVGISPGLLHNFEDGETYSNFRAEFGLPFNDRMGMSADWTDAEEINFNFTPGTNTAFDSLFSVSLYFVF